MSLKPIQFLSAALLFVGMHDLLAQDILRYTGEARANVDYHHGQLTPAVGVHNIQVFRADRSHPDTNTGLNWTYNHAPMLAYWNNQFYLEYLSNPVGEHVPPGQTLLTTSKDGKKWADPIIVFPPYRIPDGVRKRPGDTSVSKNLTAVMHQRMGFFVSSKNRLLALAYYGIAFSPKDGPNDGNGTGRVVREVKADGGFGPIYFIRYNHAFNEKNTSYPLYSSSKDKDFVAACNELLAQPLMVQAWAEEADRDDPLIALKGDYKAFNFYHLKDRRVVGLWKEAVTSISNDEGKTWTFKPVRAPGVVNSNAKIWGQRTADGKFATVYNPSEFRWPLAVSVSDDGLNYQNLLLVHGEITSMRYGGSYKSYGPQYVRGILEGNGNPPDHKLWVTYSVNKEDIWVSAIPLPVKATADRHANDSFDLLPAQTALDNWNIYSPVRAPVEIAQMDNSKNALRLTDFDPFDYAKALRVIPSSKKLHASFSIIPQQHQEGLLEVEFLDAKGMPGIRIAFDKEGTIYTKAGYRNKTLMTYTSGERYDVEIDLDTETRMYTIRINGKSFGENKLFAPLVSVSAIAFRTGETRRFPNADTPTDQNYDLPNAAAKIKPAVFYILSLQTR